MDWQLYTNPFTTVVEIDDRADLGSASEFELGTKRTGWKPVSWTRLKAAAKREGQHSRAMKLEVVARPASEGQWIEGMYQEFGTDDRAALRFAKELIREGLADSVWIDVRYSRPFIESRSFTLYRVVRKES